MMKEGAYAQRRAGVTPTVTYSEPHDAHHGRRACPARHLQQGLSPFDSSGRSTRTDGTRHAKDIRVPTPDAAAAARRVTANAERPAYGRRKGIGFNILEYRRAHAPDDLAARGARR